MAAEIGPALVTAWYMVLPLTANCLSPLPGFESCPGHVRKLPVTWGKAVVFAWYYGFLSPLTAGQSLLPQYGRRNVKYHIPSKSLQDKHRCYLGSTRRVASSLTTSELPERQYSGNRNMTLALYSKHVLFHVINMVHFSTILTNVRDLQIATILVN